MAKMTDDRREELMRIAVAARIKARTLNVMSAVHGLTFKAVTL